MQRSIKTFLTGAAIVFVVYGTARAWTPDPDMVETREQERFAYEFFNPVPDGADYYPPED